MEATADWAFITIWHYFARVWTANIVILYTLARLYAGRCGS